MKNSTKCFILFFLVTTSQIFSQNSYYIDSSTGNDSSNGLSEKNAWKSVSKVNSCSFQPGDKILFKRGELWMEQLIVSSSGSISNPIIYDAYGSGTAPVIAGAEVISKEHIHLLNIEFRSAAYFGINVKRSDHVSLMNCIIRENGSSGLNIEDGSDYVSVFNCGIYNNGLNSSGDRNGIGIGGFGTLGCSEITIEDCDIFDNHNHNIEIATNDNNNSNSNIYMRRTKLYDCKAGDGIRIGGHHYGIEVEYCLIYNNNQGGVILYEGSVSGPIITMNNCVIWDNGVGAGENNDGIFLDSNVQLTLRNCIIGESNDQEIIKIFGSTLVSDHNCWHHSKGNIFMTYHGISYNYMNWQINSSQDSNSINSDPKFINPITNDFHLKSSSPCIDTGMDVEMTRDFDKNAVPYGCCVDIGSFEYVGPPSPLSTEIDASATSGVRPLTVDFTGNATGGSPPYSCSWDFGDGDSSSEQNPSHTYNVEGNYTVNLTVTDSNDSRASDSVIITATAPSDPLSVSASASPTSGQVPLAVSFSANTNGGSSPYSYYWDFGDGDSSSDQNPSDTYNQAGTYNVTLTVTDSGSSQATDSLTIEVSSNPTFTLNISSVTGSPAPGTGGTTDPDPGSHSYSQGTSVKAKAIPDSDYRFSKWSGDVSSSNTYDKEISVTMDNDKSISAYFFTKCGDVNGDLSITAADAQWAFDIYLGILAEPTESEKENADVTCDGTDTSPNVTPADAHAIFEKFIGRNELPCDCSCKSRIASYQTQISQGHDVTVFVDSILFNESNEIVVPVALDKPFDIYTFGFDLVFPSDVLEFVGVEVPEEIKESFMVDANKIADGVIRAGGFRESFNLVHNPRTLIKLIFRVVEEEKGTISFNIINTVDDIKNASFRNRRVEEKKIGYRR